MARSGSVLSLEVALSGCLPAALSADQISMDISNLFWMSLRTYQTFWRWLVLTAHYCVDHVATSVTIVHVGRIDAGLGIAGMTGKLRPASVRLEEGEPVRSNSLPSISDVSVAGMPTYISGEEPAAARRDCHLVKW